MKLKELKDWINGLPTEFDEFTVVNGEVGKLSERYHYRVDKPLTTLTVDEESKEVVLMNDTEDMEIDLPANESDAILKTLGDELQNPEFRKVIEAETWDIGLPMFYVDADGWLVEHHKDGTINKRRKMKTTA